MDIPNATHRPWPLPHRPWVLAMQWHDLLFMHWPVPPAVLRPPSRHAGPGDLRGGRLAPESFLSAWPAHARAGSATALVVGVPRTQRPHLRDGRGEAGRLILQPGRQQPAGRARRPLSLSPALLRRRHGGGQQRRGAVHQHAHPPWGAGRRLRRALPPGGPVSYAAVDSNEYWLTERYCLYAADRRGRVWRGNIHHARWPLQPGRGRHCAQHHDRPAAQAAASRTAAVLHSGSTW